MRAMQNKADYARTHGMAFRWISALVDSRYDGAWNKLSVLHRLLAERLSAAQRNESSSSAAPQHDWVLWAEYARTRVEHST